MKKILTIFAFSLLFTTVGHLMPIHAQEISLSLSPPIVQSYIKPGNSIKVNYTLENRGDPTIIKAYLLPFEPQDIYGNVRLKSKPDDSIQFSLENSGLQLNDSFILKSGQSTNLNLVVKVPENIREGDYYYTFLIETEPPPAEQGTSTARLKTTLGSHLLLTVTSTGTIAPVIEPGLFSITPRFTFSFLGKKIQVVDSFDTVPVMLLLKNTAENLTSVTGNISLLPIIGSKKVYPLIPAYILKQSQRLMTTTPSTKANCDSQNKKCNIPRSLFISGMLLGNYTVLAQLTVPGSQPVTIASTSFTALPLKIMGFVLLLGIFIFFLKKIVVRVKVDN